MNYKDKYIILREVIYKVIKDSESGNGWGPDITVVKYLVEALNKTEK